MPQAAHRIEIPNRWSPRDYQQELWNALEAGTKRAVCIWHRRAGKDTVSINWTATQTYERVGLYWHCLPTYKQGRKIVWDGMSREGRRFLDYFPPELIVKQREDEMSLWFENGSQWQVIGAETADDVDKLVGANPVGVVFSEYSLMVPAIWNFIQPILAENGGWALFIFTPRGRNHGYEQYQLALKSDRWFSQLLTADDTGAVSPEDIEAAREDGMPEELIQQEFYCSWDAALAGAYYGDHMNKMKAEGRLTSVPHEPIKEVTTGWDLGIGDKTSIWFHQLVGKESRLIDYYESDGVGIEHYIKVLREKPYIYKEHLVPHDAQARYLGTGQTLYETARSLGLRMRVVPKLSIEDGIQAVRNLLPKTWIDETKCELGVRALREYTKEKIEGIVGPGNKTLFRDKPSHTWASNGADALRTLALGLRPDFAPRSRDQLAPKLSIV